MLKSATGKLISGLFVIMLLLGVALEIVNLKSAYWNAISAKNGATISDLKARGASCDIITHPGGC